MKLIDNTNYKEIYDEFLQKAGKIEDAKNDNLILTIFSSFFSIAFLAMAITSMIEVTNIQVDSERLIPVLCFTFSIIFFTLTTSFISYMMNEYSNNVGFIVQFRKVIPEINELDAKSKLIKISEIFGSSYINYLNIERINNNLEFINYKVTKAILDAKNKNLSITYLKNNGTIDKKICCDVKYFENLDEPEITIDKNKISLNIRCENKSLEVIDLTSYF